MSAITRAWQRLSGEWDSLIEKPLSTEEIGVAMDQASLPDLRFYFMLSAAALIATFGLLANSAPAIIGAMIIAPLMAPIVSLAYGVVTVNLHLIGRSAFTVVTGLVIVIGLAYISTLIVGLRVAGSEILSRASPTLLDLGVALVAGAAAAFAHSRRSIMNSIAGVAIAVALVPPLAVTGISIAQGTYVSGDVGIALIQLGIDDGGADIASGSFILFVTNLVGIIFVAGFVFLAEGYGKKIKAGLSLLVLGALSMALLDPLGASMNRLYIRSQALSLISQLQQRYPDIFSRQITLDKILVKYKGEDLHVTVEGQAPRATLAGMQNKVDTFQKLIQTDLNHPVVVKVNMVPVDIQSFRAGPQKNARLDNTKKQ